MPERRIARLTVEGCRPKRAAGFAPFEAPIPGRRRVGKIGGATRERQREQGGFGEQGRRTL